MSRSSLLLIALGGALGASVRWALLAVVDTGDLPASTLAANVVGAGLLGWLVGAAVRPQTRALLATGFCGGLTTMSTLGFEVARYLEDQRFVLGLSYLLASMVLGVGAWRLGRQLARGRRQRQPC